MADTPEWERVAAQLRAQAESRERPRELHAAVLQLAGRLAGGRVLDVGCGDGALVRVLAARGAHAEGVDASPERVRDAERLAREAGIAPLPRFSVADPSNLASLPAGPFDLITALLVLDPAAKPISELRGLAKRLRPGGRLVLAFAHPYGDGTARTRPLEAFFGSLRDVGLRAVDLVEPQGDGPDQRYLAVLCERRGRRPRRKRG